MSTLSRRHDFVFLYDVISGNPNGDPDNGNLPRLDPETSHGLITDVSIKRKIRNYVELAKGDERGYRIYVREKAILNETHREAYKVVRPENSNIVTDKKLNPQSEDEARALVRFMCENFYDVRTFGAVMSTGINCGQVRGPVQLSFGRSIEPIFPMEITITRMAATTLDENNRRDGDGIEDRRVEARTMGRKYIVPYGLYRTHGFVSAKLAERTGFGDQDLDLLLEALARMFDHDRSAARGEMAARSLILFSHTSALGNAAAHDLFDRVQVRRRIGSDTYALGDQRLDNLPPARCFLDYQIIVDRSKMAGVEMLELI